MPIRILSDTLASQIAAGEVVERPASVVKELVENAIDAGATTINVDIKNGGQELIQISDNGAGISPDEIETAFKRHATSKLETATDLAAIATLGFRGEALAAISAVSQTTVVSRGKGERAGVRLVIHGGDIVSKDAVGAPQGTVIAVENLFYNMPARLKFLKSAGSEKRVIDEFVTRYALAYPHIRFRLIHNGRITFQSSGNGVLRDVLVAVYGVDVARELLEIQEIGGQEDTGAEGQKDDNDFLSSPPLVTPSSRPPVSVSGFVSPPSLHRANRGQISLFVNGRHVKDTSLTYAIVQAYHTLLPVGRFPLAVIFVTLPLDQVDVNVHPAKTEVRFHHGNKVFGAVQKAVRNTLIGDTPIRGFTQITQQRMPAWGGNLDRPQMGGTQSRLQMPPRAFDETIEWGIGGQEDMGTGRQADGFMPPRAGSPASQPDMGGDKLPIMRVVGQVGTSYIITEGPDGMFMVDQHAAHERILYEQFIAEWGRDGVASQGLLAGAVVHVTPAQATLLNESMDVLAALGFVVEAFGPNAFMVRGMPALLAKRDPAQALLSIVEDLESGNTPMQETIEAKIIKRVCKTAAVKAGQTLSLTEMNAMIQQLEHCHNPHTCPHGRPTLIHLSMMQLAKEFGRT